MVKEQELKDPIARHLYHRFDDVDGVKFLCHEEPRGKGMRAPDLLFVHGPEKGGVLGCIIEVVEIENKLKDAIRSRRHGLNQLKKYPGHLKYLAIPHTIHRIDPKKIDKKCNDRRMGLLVVGKDQNVEEVVEPWFDEESKSLRAYPTVLRRCPEEISR
jgi:hypothetical protein